MTLRPADTDERTHAIENESYRWGYLFLSYGLLAAVAHRAIGLDQPSWDLLALVVTGGAAATLVQAQHRILGHRWLLNAAAVMAVALAMAIILVYFAR